MEESRVNRMRKVREYNKSRTDEGESPKGEFDGFDVTGDTDIESKV